MEKRDDFTAPYTLIIITAYSRRGKMKEA